MSSTGVRLDWPLKPDGLTVGDTFRLLFVTSGERNAASTNLQDYDAFVQDRASFGHPDIRAFGPVFKVGGCSEDVSIKSHTDTISGDTDGAHLLAERQQDRRPLPGLL